MTANIYLGSNQAAFDSGEKWDLAIVDPPYGMPKDSTHGRGKLKTRILNNGGVEKWDTAPDAKYFKELKNAATNQIIWGGNYFHLPPSRCMICWDKCQPWENFSQIELAWTSFNSVARLFKFDNRTGNKVHPTQKPIALYKWLLKNYAKEGDSILDTHGGSMSSVIACIEMGFDIDVWEMDPDYYAAAKKRILNHVQQLPLFGTPPIINFYE